MTKKMIVEAMCDVCGAVRPNKGAPDHYELQHSDRSILLAILRELKKQSPVVNIKIKKSRKK